MTSPIRKLTLVTALAFAAVPAAAAPARAATGMEVAIQDDKVLVEQAYLGRTKGFQLADQLHATWIKVNVSWANSVNARTSKTKPSTVKYDFSSFDTFVLAARSAGFQVEMSLTGPDAPAWATGDKKLGHYKPNPKLYAEFATAFAQHFKGLVTRYSIWNEPNHIGWLTPLKSQPSLYRQLYTKGYAAAKAVDPDAQVLIGETAPYAARKGSAMPPLEFLRGFTKSGSLTADGYAHHPYDFDHKPTFKFPGADNVTLSGLSKLTKALNTLASQGKLADPSGDPLDLYLTEYGYFASGKRKTPENTRAQYIAQAFGIALKNSRVRQMLQFLLATPPKKYLFFDTSIVSRSGSKTKTFNALKTWADQNLGKLAQ